MSDRDIGPIAVELQGQVGPAWHLPDEVRVGVLAGIEEYETWLQAHFLRCQGCREPLISLFSKLQGARFGLLQPSDIACGEARNAIFHYLETGREPAPELLAHIIACESCSVPFFEPAKNVVLLEYDPDETGEAG